VNLTLKGGDRSNDEYTAPFALPDGAYISNYYLDVGSERKYGTLADKRAAMSVYESIVRVNKDPGVVRYANDSQLELRVFPFGIGETRRTGIEIIHSQAFDFCIDGQTVALEAENAPDEIRFKGGALVSGSFKQTLHKVAAREPATYFIIDCSAHSQVGYQMSLIQDYASMCGISEAQVIFASYGLTETTLSDMRKAAPAPSHGFNLALAIRKILAENGDDTAPVIIFTSGNPAVTTWPEHASSLAVRFLESPFYYRLREDFLLVPYAFDANQDSAPIAEPVFLPLLSYQGMYLRDDGNSEIVALPGSSASSDAPVGSGSSTSAAASKSSGSAAGRFAVTGSQYLDALALHTALRSRPSMGAAESLAMLRASFRTHVLTSQTAFIVLETSEQEAELLRTQELLLEKDSATARETLDEPPMLLMIAITAVAAFACLLARACKRKRARARDTCLSRA
jgi:hypothetical protein